MTDAVVHDGLPRRLVIRPSWQLRIFGVLVLIVGGAGMVASVFVDSDAGGGGEAFLNGVVFLPYGILVLRALVIATPTRLLVRNRFRSYTVPWADVTSIELVKARRTVWQMLRLPRPERTVGKVNRASGSPVLMYATERNNYGVPDGFFGVPKNVEDVQRLEAYRQAAIAHFSTTASGTPN